MNWTLQIGEHCIEDVSDPGQLRQRLLEIHEPRETGSVLRRAKRADGSSLAVGLGRELSVLGYARRLEGGPGSACARQPSE